MKAFYGRRQTLEKMAIGNDDDINREITNICRCGTYVRLRKAIHEAAKLIAKEN